MNRPRRALLSPGGIAGIILAGLPAAVAGLAVVWTPYSPVAMDFDLRFASSSWHHWLGTDQFGRDEASRLMAGASASMLVALATVTVATFAGSILGALAGYFLGWLDAVLRLVTDSLLAFPGILLAVAIMMALGQTRYGIILALGLAYFPTVFRVVRGHVLSLARREFVEASRAMGNSSAFTIYRHVLPNCRSPLIVLATSMFGWVILAESALSFLGLGVPPPTPTWGNMLAESRAYMDDDALLSILPGLCISAALLGVNLLGDHLRDRFDPRMRDVR